MYSSLSSISFNINLFFFYFNIFRLTIFYNTVEQCRLVLYSLSLMFNNDTRRRRRVLIKINIKLLMKTKKWKKEKETRKTIKTRVRVLHRGNLQLFPTTNFAAGPHACARAHASPAKLYGNFGAVTLAPECFV